MDVKYQIFISSTFRDLRTERRVVMEQILNLGHIPVGMELFQAADESQWLYIQERIRECDYYAVLVAERYGSEHASGKSYTQLEYEFAIECGVPVIAFLLDDESRRSWPKENVEFEAAEKINSFRALCEQKLCKYWCNEHDLAAKFTTSLIELTRRTKRPGWVRADSVASASALNELATLSEEKRRLQAELDELKSRDTGLTMPADICHRLNELRKTRVIDLIDYGPSATRDVSVAALIILLENELALGATSFDIESSIGIMMTPDGSLYPLRADSRNVLSLLLLNELIEDRVVPTSSGSTRREYRFSDYGKRFLMYAKIAPQEVPEEEVETSRNLWAIRA